MVLELSEHSKQAYLSGEISYFSESLSLFFFKAVGIDVLGGEGGGGGGGEVKSVTNKVTVPFTRLLDISRKRQHCRPEKTRMLFPVISYPLRF